MDLLAVREHKGVEEAVDFLQTQRELMLQLDKFLQAAYRQGGPQRDHAIDQYRRGRWCLMTTIFFLARGNPAFVKPVANLMTQHWEVRAATTALLETHPPVVSDAAHLLMLSGDRATAKTGTDEARPIVLGEDEGDPDPHPIFLVSDNGTKIKI